MKTARNLSGAMAATGKESSGVSRMSALFDSNALETLKKVEAIFTQRGNEYGDTWRNCTFTTLKAVAKELGATIPDHALRAVATAAFVDMKYQRMEGGYKSDNIHDGIAYMAFLDKEMEIAKAKMRANSVSSASKSENEVCDGYSNGCCCRQCLDRAFIEKPCPANGVNS